jgi:cell division topological specificity factor
MSTIRKWLQARRDGSGNVAKERLRLVLVHNRLAMSPELLESLKSEMIGVLSRYFEIDQNSLVVDVRRGEHSHQLGMTISVKPPK